MFSLLEVVPPNIEIFCVDSSNVCWCREHGLPGHYLDTLHRIEHNGEQRGDGSITITLGRF